MGSDGSAAGGGRSDLSEWQRSAGNEPDLPGEVTDGNRNRANWQKIKTEYITTDTSYRKLAQKYGISHVQIARVGKAEGWVELREQHVTNTIAKTVESISQQEVDRATRIRTVADKLLDKIEAVVEAVEPKNMSAKDIRSLTAAVKDLKEIQGVKSSLDQQEQEARIANLRKQADKDSDTVEGIEVVFQAGEEAWNE